MLGDMPEVTADLVAEVRAGFNPGSGRAICIATANGQRGHPVLWARCLFPEIARLDGDAGAKSLFAASADLIYEIPAPGRVALTDIDTPDDLAHLLTATHR